MHDPQHPARRRHLSILAAGAACLALHPLRATASSFKSLQVVVPTPAGAQPDVIARWLIEPMARRAGVPGTVLNRPGAAGAIAADAVLAAPAEAGTLLLGGLDHVAYSHLNSNRRPLDPFVDFVPVGAVNRDSWLVVTRADAPSRTLAALTEQSRRTPLNYATLGEGSTAHLLSARLCKAVGIDAQHVPYKESFAPDLIAGRIDFAVAPTPSQLPQIRGGRVHALAALTDKSLTLLPDVPSIAELGWPDQVFHGGLFLFAPSSLASEAGRLNSWLVQSLAQPDVMERYRTAAIEPTPLNLDDVRSLVTERLRSVDAMRLAVFGRTR